MIDAKSLTDAQSLARYSMIEIRDAIKARTVSASNVMRYFLSRIDQHDSKTGAFLTVNSQAQEAASKIDRDLEAGRPVGALAGVPVAVKDLLCTEAMRTTAASKILEHFVQPYSATVVERLQSAGAIVIGKTSLDEFAMGSSNENSAFGPVRNPWNLEFVPGGSSGGSAAALAARYASAAIGTDTGGSIRQPASFCGVVGLKPTYGRVSRYGVIAFASSLDQAGPIAHTVRDCALLSEVISGVCRKDSTTSSHDVPAWSQQIRTVGKGFRVGLPREYFASKVDPEVERVTQNAIAALKKCGVEFVDVSLPLVQHAVSVYYLVATSEASSNLARYDGVRFGYRAPTDAASAPNLEEFYSANRGDAFGSEVKRRIMLGTYALSSGYYDAYYQKAGQVRRLLRDEFTRAFESCDVILSPVATTPAFRLGERISDPLTMYLNDIFTTSANLAGLPALSVPAGFSSSGLPIGVQLMGSHFDEQSLFNAAATLESALAVEHGHAMHERLPDGFA